MVYFWIATELEICYFLDTFSFKTILLLLFMYLHVRT